MIIINICQLQEEDNDWDWRSLCKDFSFESQIPHLENRLETHYAGDVKNFIQEYLEPVLALLKDIKLSAEVVNYIQKLSFFHFI